MSEEVNFDLFMSEPANEDLDRGHSEINLTPEGFTEREGEFDSVEMDVSNRIEKDIEHYDYKNYKPG